MPLLSIKSIPIVLFGKDFWQRAVKFEVLVEEGTISPEDVHLFNYVETAEEAWDIILKANKWENADRNTSNDT